MAANGKDVPQAELWVATKAAELLRSGADAAVDAAMGVMDKASAAAKRRRRSRASSPDPFKDVEEQEEAL